MGSRAVLRELLTNGKLTQVASVYDGLTARLAQAVGFEALSVTGNGISGSLLGKPDMGLVSLAETAAVRATSTPPSTSPSSSTPTPATPAR